MVSRHSSHAVLLTSSVYQRPEPPPMPLPSEALGWSMRSAVVPVCPSPLVSGDGLTEGLGLGIPMGGLKVGLGVGIITGGQAPIVSPWARWENSDVIATEMVTVGFCCEPVWWQMVILGIPLASTGWANPNRPSARTGMSSNFFIYF